MAHINCMYVCDEKCTDIHCNTTKRWPEYSIVYATACKITMFKQRIYHYRFGWMAYSMCILQKHWAKCLASKVVNILYVASLTPIQNLVLGIVRYLRQDLQGTFLLFRKLPKHLQYGGLGVDRSIALWRSLHGNCLDKADDEQMRMVCHGYQPAGGGGDGVLAAASSSAIKVWLTHRPTYQKATKTVTGRPTRQKTRHARPDKTGQNSKNNMQVSVNWMNEA